MTTISRTLWEDQQIAFEKEAATRQDSRKPLLQRKKNSTGQSTRSKQKNQSGKPGGKKTPLGENSNRGNGKAAQEAAAGKKQGGGARGAR